MSDNIYPPFGADWNSQANKKLRGVEGLIRVIEGGYQPSAFPSGFSARHQMVLAHLARANRFAETGIELALRGRQDELTVITRVISEHWFKLAWIWDSDENYLTLLVGEEVYDYLKTREPKHATTPESEANLRRSSVVAARRLRNYRLPPGRYTRPISSDPNKRRDARKHNPCPYKKPPSLKEIAHECGYFSEYEYLYNLQSKETHPSVAALNKYIKPATTSDPWQLIKAPPPTTLLRVIDDLRFVLFGIIEVMETKGCKVEIGKASALFML